MDKSHHRSPWLGRVAGLVLVLILMALLVGEPGRAQKSAADVPAEYASLVQPLLRKYCLSCHSTKLHKGSLDLERFASLDDVRKDLKPWQQLIEMLEAGEMPPKAKPQPTAGERRRLVAWVRQFLAAEAKARAGDPGLVPLRRLSNTEYDCTIRDLTGVDLRPTREFPADGAAGEGFTNAAEALTDISPTLLNKYLNAAKDIADHAVLLPDGFRFSPSKTRRDWTDESTAQLRQFYAAYATGDGRLPLQPYLVAAVRHRDALLAGKTTPAGVASREKLNVKYFHTLWHALTDKTPSYPLDVVRARWRRAREKDVPALAGDIAGWQAVLWKTTRIGSYVRPEGAGYVESTTRQVAVDPAAAASVPLRVAVKPSHGPADVVLYLTAREVTPGATGSVLWHRPRFEGAGEPSLLLRDYAEYGPAYEIEKPRPTAPRYGLARERFGPKPGFPEVDGASLATTDAVTEVRLPAALFAGREFVVEGRLDSAPGERVIAFQVATAPPGPEARWPGAGPVLAAPDGANYRRLVQGCHDFRRVFPLFVCFPAVVPTDEVVSLKMFHREDEPLTRLFLDAEQQRRLDHRWAEHRFISRQPVAENDYLPLFIGFVTQDQPKTMLAYFESQRPVFQRRAEQFLNEEKAAIPKQLDALLEFAARAYRRPLTAREKTDLLVLYRAIRGKGSGRDEAFRGVLARVLLAPAFLFRIEQAPPGKEPAAVNDWELATRLSYFLWSSMPDAELRRLAAAGRLHDPRVLAAQVERMLKDDRLRALAIEFGTQWLHVRGFDQFAEKNEQLFPAFDSNLRKAMYEEAILFFQDLFRNDRRVTALVDADYTFLNDALAKHYGIPGVTGPQWRRVEGVRKYGRGGILGFGSVQSKQAAASRTSPVLRGNWVVETLLGEKLPRPPANVPRLPEAEGAGGLTVRQQVEMHAKAPACAGCHVRIDPFGFALEKYDAIGRLRATDQAGLAVDTTARLQDGTEFDGLDGLRAYLLTKKKDVVVRLFCRRLLGYALGRAVTLSDQSLIDEMLAELDRTGGKVAALVQVIVHSRQFTMVRGSAYTE